MSALVFGRPVLDIFLVSCQLYSFSKEKKRTRYFFILVGSFSESPLSWLQDAISAFVADFEKSHHFQRKEKRSIHMKFLSPPPFFFFFFTQGGVSWKRRGEEEEKGTWG